MIESLNNTKFILMKYKKSRKAQLITAHKILVSLKICISPLPEK